MTQLLNILPHSYKRFRHISEYKGQTIVIDAPMFAHINIIHPDGYIKSTIDLLTYLLSYHIKLIFIFDGQKPVEKNLETCLRRREKRNRLDYYRGLEEDLFVYKKTNVCSPALLSLQKKLKSNFTPRMIQYFIKKGKQKISIVTENDYIKFQQILSLFGVPFLIAKGEGEILCSDLVKSGLADAVLSRDSDVLAAGTPIILFDFNFQKNTFTEIRINELLLELDLDYTSWLDLCILCGTDFNDKLCILSVEEIYDLIKLHKRISQLPLKECSEGGVCPNLPLSEDIDKIRNLFTLSIENQITEIPKNNPLDFEKIAMYIVDKKLNISLIHLKRVVEKYNKFLSKSKSKSQSI